MESFEALLDKAYEKKTAKDLGMHSVKHALPLNCIIRELSLCMKSAMSPLEVTCAIW